jgi:hypothetical protein
MNPWVDGGVLYVFNELEKIRQYSDEKSANFNFLVG